MKDNNRIIVLYNTITGKLQMITPNSLIIKWGLFTFLVCGGLAILLHQIPPVINAVAGMLVILH